MPRRKYTAAADSYRGNGPRSYRQYGKDLSSGSAPKKATPDRLAKDAVRPKKKVKKIQKKHYKNRRSFSEPSQVPQNAITLFCDGCCFPTNPGKCGWAFAECESGDRCYGGLAWGTNNQAEMTGAIEALKYVAAKELHRGGRPVIVFCDSQYVVRGCMQWLPKWKQSNWKKGGGDGSGLKNVELWKEIDELLEKTGVQFRWVKGHNGNHWNELCDRLASEGATKQIRKLLLGNRARNTALSLPVDEEFVTMSSFTEDFLVSAETLLF